MTDRNTQADAAGERERDTRKGDPRSDLQQKSKPARMRSNVAKAAPNPTA